MSQEKNISQEIMAKIRSGKTKMKPKIYFTIQRAVLIFLLALAVLLSVLLINFAIYIIKQNGILEFLEFGNNGWLAVWENIPHAFIIWSIIFLLISYLLFRQFDFSYQKPAYFFTIALLVLGLGGGFTLAATGANEKINHSKINSLPVMKQAFELASAEGLKAENGLIAKIQDIKPHYLVAKTTAGKLLIIKINNNSQTDELEETEITPYQLSTKFKAKFNDPYLDEKFDEMMARHQAIMAKFDQSHIKQLQQIKNRQWQKGQTIKIIGNQKGDHFYPQDLKPTQKQNYYFKATQEN